MTPEKPAEGITMLRNRDDVKMYKVQCSCGSNSCQHTVVVEAAADSVNVIIYSTVYSKWWTTSRWKQMWRLLTTGYVEHEEAIIMTQQQALNYAATLTLSVDDVGKHCEPAKNE